MTIESSPTPENETVSQTNDVVTESASNEESLLGPPKTTVLNVVLRTLGGLGGGIIGTGVIFLFAILGSDVLQNALNAVNTEDEVNPLFVFFFLAMVFLGSGSANLLSTLFMGLFERQKYRHVSTTLTQIFVVNLVILVILAPVYVVISSLKIELIGAVAALQMVISAFASALILEIIADYRYALLGVYSTVFAVLVSSGLNFLIYTLSGENPAVLLFGALPVIWVSIGLFNGLLGWLYGWIYRAYGTDFLSTAVMYGADERWISADEEQQQELEAEKAAEAKKRDSGGAFLDQ